MSKLLILTDLHILAEGRRIIGLDPSERLAQGLAHAARNHPDADRLILMGDLTHHGLPEEYDRLRALLSGLPWPVSPMIGNHDRRAAFRAAFPEVPTTPEGFVQDVIDLRDVRLILLDSADEEAEIRDAGRLCPARLAHLDAALAGAGGRPCLVFMHHHAFDSGFAGMDRIALANAAELRARLRGSAAVHLYAGHIHRTISATIDGIPMTVFKSPCHQMPMRLGAEGSDHSIDEPGAYGIVLTRGGDVVTHFEDFTLPPREIHNYNAT